VLLKWDVRAGKVAKRDTMEKIGTKGSGWKRRTRKRRISSSRQKHLGKERGQHGRRGSYRGFGVHEKDSNKSSYLLGPNKGQGEVLEGKEEGKP